MGETNPSDEEYYDPYWGNAGGVDDEAEDDDADDGRAVTQEDGDDEESQDEPAPVANPHVTRSQHMRNPGNVTQSQKTVGTPPNRKKTAGNVTQSQKTVGMPTQPKKTAGNATQSQKTAGNVTQSQKTVGKATTQPKKTVPGRLATQAKTTTGRATPAQKTPGNVTQAQKTVGTTTQPKKTGSDHEGRPAETARPEPEGMPGTLLHKVLTTLHSQPQYNTPDHCMAHMTKWVDLISDGWRSFTHATLVERGRPDPTPIVFAALTGGEHYIQLVHTFGQMALRDETHPCDGRLGFFLGDRLITSFDGKVVVREPAFLTLRDPATLTGITVQPASDATITKMHRTLEFTRGSKSANSMVHIPICLPLPLPWVPYFLQHRRTNQEAYGHMRQLLSQLPTDTATQAFKKDVLGWFRAACTHPATDTNASILDLPVRLVPPDQEVLDWTMKHFQTLLPPPARRGPPTTPAQVTKPAATVVSPPQPDSSPEADNRHAALCDRVLALSESVLADRLDRDKPTTSMDATKTKLSEVELCRLLGYCGLSWEEQHLLPPIWIQLKQQTDRASRESVLAAFFGNLATQEPSLKHFRNQAFFDDIINHRFLPGDTYDTCHKGFSPLVFLPRTHAEIHAESAADDFYNEATVKTVAEVRKHHTKGPPQIPTTDTELLRVNARDVAVLKAFFTPWSSLVQHEVELQDGLVEQQMDLFSNPDTTRDLIPHLLWAKIKARRKFFLHMCTRDMLDTSEDRAPIIAKASLRPHTLLFLSDTKVAINGVPSQWLTAGGQQHNTPLGGGPSTKKPRIEHSNGGRGEPNVNDGRHHDPSNDDRRDGPRRPSINSTAGGKNHTGPAIFSQSPELNQLLRKFPKVPLSTLADAAGFRSPLSLNTDGLPENCCLLWLVFGYCGYHKCQRTHPTSINNDAATALYKQLLPGINKLKQLNELPAPAPGRPTAHHQQQRK